MSDNGQTPNWIPDGYTQTFYFREVKGIHGEARVQARVIGILQQAQIDRELQEAADDYEKRQWVAARWISQQVVSWDLKKPSGDPVDHSNVSELIKGLRPALFNRIWACLNNQDGGDLDPKASEYETHKRAQREQALAMAEKETTPQEVLEGN